MDALAQSLLAIIRQLLPLAEERAAQLEIAAHAAGRAAPSTSIPSAFAAAPRAARSARAAVEGARRALDAHPVPECAAGHGRSTSRSLVRVCERCGAVTPEGPEAPVREAMTPERCGRSPSGDGLRCPGLAWWVDVSPFAVLALHRRIDEAREALAP